MMCKVQESCVNVFNKSKIQFKILFIVTLLNINNIKTKKIYKVITLECLPFLLVIASMTETYKGKSLFTPIKLVTLVGLLPLCHLHFFCERAS
jgi:hypothetical protein